MKLLGISLTVIILTLPSIFGIDGELPLINDVIKHTEGYSYSATIKFTYSSILTTLYNKIDILICNYDSSAGVASHCQLANTINAIIDTEYALLLEGLSPGAICFQVCGRSNYRNVRKCSKLFPLNNSIKRKVIPSANKHISLSNKQAEIIPAPINTPNSLLGHVSGYDLIIYWKIPHHLKPELSLKIRLLAEVDRQLVFPNGEKERIIPAGVTSTSVRLPYNHFNYDIQITLCSLQTPSGDVKYEKECLIPYVIRNDVTENNRDAGVSRVTVDRGIASVKLNKAIPKQLERVYVECTWSDTRVESSSEQVMKQEIEFGNDQLWSLSVTELDMHSAYACLVHLVRGNAYSLLADKPFVFDTPDL